MNIENGAETRQTTVAGVPLTPPGVPLSTRQRAHTGVTDLADIGRVECVEGGGALGFAKLLWKRTNRAICIHDAIWSLQGNVASISESRLVRIQ
jgi:hypothetical protein